MGGCATKFAVLKEEGEAPKPAEDLSAVVDTSNAAAAGEESKDEIANGPKSLGIFFAEKEAEENAAAINEEDPQEEKGDVKLKQQDEENNATEAAEAYADTAAADEKL